MKNIKYIMILYVAISWLMSLSSCNTWQNHSGASTDIAESKKRGVFICEYEANPNPIKINDSLIFDVTKAWVERHWKYPENRNETDVIDGYQLIIITKHDIYKGFNITQKSQIGLSNQNEYNLSFKNCLVV